MNSNSIAPGLSPKSFDARSSLRYLISFPETYDQDPTNAAGGGGGWPLLLFLHGAGERGSDLASVQRHGPPRQVSEGIKLPFVLVAPQCPANSWWEAGNLKLLVESIQQSHRVDVDRTYCTGISMGGFGTWELVMRFPDLFAAVAPICGGGDPFGVRLQVRSQGHLPIWAFHGDADMLVPLARSTQMVDAFRSLGNPDVKLTVYPGVGHDSWTQTYNNPELYRWMLRHKRSV